MDDVTVVTADYSLPLSGRGLTPVDETCMAYNFESGHDCERAATVMVMAGCVHEHLGLRELCAPHAGDLTAGIALCGECREADGHRCPLRQMARSPLAVPRA